MIEVFNTGKSIPNFPKIILPKEIETQLMAQLKELPKEYEVVQIAMIKRKTKRRPQMEILSITCKVNPAFLQGQIVPNTKSKKAGTASVVRINKAKFFNHEKKKS